MFVYKKGALKKEINALTGDTAEMELHHEPSGVRIGFKFFTDEPDDAKMKSCKDGKVNMISSYEIYKWKAENKYAFKDEVWDAKETLLKNFQNAIEVFEQRIFEQLNEQAPQPTNEQAEPPEGGNTFSILPEVGDFVQQGSRFGRVLDVDQTTRMVKIEKMTRKEVMDILRAQKNEAIGMSAEMRAITDSLMEEEKYDDGGIMSIEEDFFVVQVEEDGSNLIILRVQEPQQGGGGQQEPQGESQDSPDNVQDPFEENEGGGAGEGDGQGGGGGEGGDQGGDEGADENGDQGSDQDGDQGGNESGSQAGEPSGGQEGQGGEGNEQGGNQGDGKGDGQGDGGFSGGTQAEWQPSDDFGDDDFFDEDDLDKVMDSVKEQLEQIKQEERDESLNTDVATLAAFLSLNEANIKSNFTSPQEVLATIGGRKVFESNNKERITNALNLIFSN